LAVGHILGRKTNKIIMIHDLGKCTMSPSTLRDPWDYSADGCADVCTDNGCLRLQIVLGNSSPELLGLVSSLLQSHFQLHSNTYLRKRKGATWKNGSKTVFLRKDAYALQIQRSMMCECSLMRLVS